MIKKLIACLICVLFVGVVEAQEKQSAEQYKRTAQEIYLEINSPFCPGRSLHDCPTEKASELKEKILTQLTEGKVKEEVITNLATEFGNSIKALPDFKGANILAWLLPVVFIGIGALMIRRTLRGGGNKR